MRGLILLCICTLAFAVPQGYMYPGGHQQKQSTGGQLNAEIPYEAAEELEIQSKLQQEQSFLLEQDLAPPHEQPRHFSTENLPTSEEHMPVPLRNFELLQHVSEPFQNDVIVTKQFSLHSAQDEQEEEIVEKIVNVGQSRKNYNVVFIRAPVESRKTTAIKIVPAVNEDKTVVYVLSKKLEADDIITHVQEVPTTTTKPEVHFIKYKTEEEARHAQGKIQADYDRLGGSTFISNEGVSPVSSVIGSLDAKTDREESHVLKSENFSMEKSVSLPFNNGYLPPNYYHKK